MIEKLLDPYELKARVAPGLIVALPIVADAIYASPALSSWPIFTLESVTGIALIYGLSHVVRARGEAIEKHLWESWGGPPSTRVLRHRDRTWGHEIKASIGQAITKVFSAHLPTPDEERFNGVRADKRIADAFRQVREYLRQHNPNGLWFKHNVEYGFSRNLLGCRVLWAAVSLLATAFAITYAVRTGGHILNPASAVGLLSLTCALYLGWIVLPGSTKRIADGYAETAWTAFLNLAKQDKAGAAAGKSTSSLKQNISTKRK